MPCCPYGAFIYWASLRSASGICEKSRGEVRSTDQNKMPRKGQPDNNREQTMVQDLSYLSELPSEAQEEAVKKAIEQECFKAIYTYLDNLANLMEAKNIEALNVPTVRAMAEEMKVRSEGNEENSN